MGNRKLVFSELHEADCYRNSNGGGYAGWFLYTLRKNQCVSNRFSRIFWRIVYRLISECHGMEISRTACIGKGLYIGHSYNITINGKAVIGDFCNIHKGVLIGQENRGKRKGVPVIGNRVWIGINAVIVGKITIGNDVLIAPNSYVNCDVPDHSIVFGNPCVIKHRDNATEGYVNRCEDL